jgi:hypothetical protein
MENVYDILYDSKWIMFHDYWLLITLSLASRKCYIAKKGDPNPNVCCGPSTWSTSLYTRLECPSLAKLDLYVPHYDLWMIFKAMDLGWCLIKQPPLSFES